MRILYLTTWCPFPSDNGSKIRTAYLLRALARRHDVTLLTFSEAGLSTDEITALAPPLAGVYSIQDSAFRYNDVPAAVKYASPMPTAFWKNPTMAAQLTALAATSPFDIVAAMSVPVRALPVPAQPHAAPARPGTIAHPGAGRALPWGTGPALQTTLSPGLAQIRHLRGPIHPQIRRMYARVAKEVDYYTQMAPEVASRLAVIPNGVDLEQMKPGIAPKEETALIFNGALTYSVTSTPCVTFSWSISSYPATYAPRLTHHHRFDQRRGSERASAG